MPMYDYQCRLCTTAVTEYRRIADRAELPHCHGCDLPMQRVLSAPFVRGDYQAYNCPVTGALIQGRKAHTENLKRQNCRLQEPGERQDFEKRRARESAALEAKIDNTVESTIHNMPVRKREQLAVELQAGVTANVVRG